MSADMSKFRRTEVLASCTVRMVHCHLAIYCVLFHLSRSSGELMPSREVMYQCMRCGGGIKDCQSHRVRWVGNFQTRRPGKNVDKRVNAPSGHCSTYDVLVLDDTAHQCTQGSSTRTAPFVFIREASGTDRVPLKLLSLTKDQSIDGTRGMIYHRLYLPGTIGGK